MTRKICLATILVNDIHKATDFYVDKLGFEQRNTPHPPHIVPLISDGVPLVLSASDEVRKNDSEHATVILAIETDDIAGAMTMLKQKGIAFATDEPQPFPVGLRAEFRDPSGNILELIQWN